MPLAVIKIGGNILDDAEQLEKFLTDFAEIPVAKILVHGGGKLASELSVRLGITPQIIHGRRITDAETLKVATMTYAGWVNKNLVAILVAKQCSAIGLSGADACLLPAVKRPATPLDFGFVGDLITENVNTGFLQQLLTANLTPVIAPIAADRNGQLLNVNADTVARTIAEAMAKFYEVDLVYCFEKNGLLLNIDDEHSVIPELNFEKAAHLKQVGVISSGMLPKIDNAFAAIKSGVKKVVIGHAKNIHDLVNGEGNYGTTIRKKI